MEKATVTKIQKCIYSLSWKHCMLSASLRVYRVMYILSLLLQFTCWAVAVCSLGGKVQHQPRSVCT